MMQESPFKYFQMQSTISKLRNQVHSLTAFLTPLLPLANCHMVEMFTENHWDKLVPTALRQSLESYELNDAVDKFWEAIAMCDSTDTSELTLWIKKARSHYITVNNDYCLNVKQLQSRIQEWGGQVKSEIRVTQFMTSKKSYEVQTMSSLVASLYNYTQSTCCVEAGGGRGHLPVALTLGYGVPSLTIDCADKTIEAAAERIKIIQKQWHSIAKRIKDGNEVRMHDSINKNLHRFASAYITSDTDVAAIVREKFPEQTDVKLLLTGLHTCGNLGPDSLRVFTTQPFVSAVFNVPCCYHLLTEEVDAAMFDVFERNFGSGLKGEQGFPMSEFLRGYKLGRNARMLAAQSIDRVVHHKQLPDKSLLYRAVLQVIIKTHLPSFPFPEGKLKRLSTKCQGFRDYLKMADATLNLGLYDNLSESYLADVNAKMDVRWKYIVLFYLLRLCLAQVVESVILLDRLLFLFESGFRDVFLVKLFDPVLSPRCHSIVAVR
ncbi:probable methyltransferase-like protein 25 isoform X2 [Plodia interpunctella]|uniref:probable methyltransferase-like protein 25 isoform X2 n=1 Tax=Plodia interpunctella TaxID=58824 RepID=UPI0023674F5D|nr:probable methyltransferase-like protein 25 isoform X2 [Plodia interpunctella]